MTDDRSKVAFDLFYVLLVLLTEGVELFKLDLYS